MLCEVSHKNGGDSLIHVSKFLTLKWGIDNKEGTETGE